jgi:molybdopterin-guanine dinucleotide biosynthesis protein A
LNHVSLTNIGAAILAGGKSTRYNGTNKALLKISDETILERNIAILSPLFKEIHIISNRPEDFTHYNLPVFADMYKDIGPLGGIFTALHHTDCEAAFVFSCDMPFLSSEVILDIQDFFTGNSFDIVIPQLLEKIEPLHAIYSKDILPLMEEHIKGTDNYKIRLFFNKVSTSYLSLENTEKNRRAFLNINTSEDHRLINELL